jgi:uncharacterized protein YndB with AHSA1/START domain
MSPSVHRSIAVNGSPKDVFGYLHDPQARARWDAMSDLVRLEADAPAAGVRVHFRGRRTAPSWVGEFETYDAPRRSVIRLVEGVGMPFSEFRETLTVKPDGRGSRVDMTVEYTPRGLLRLLDPFTSRPRITRASDRSLRAVADHFA